MSKTLYTKTSDKMECANSTDPVQTAPEAVRSGSTMFALPLSILRNNCIKSKIKVRQKKYVIKYLKFYNIYHTNFILHAAAKISKDMTVIVKEELEIN